MQTTYHAPDADRGAVLSWTSVLDSLVAQRPIAKFTKFDGAVELSRQWDASRHCAVWSKVYHGDFELAAFNEWEFDLLRRLSAFKVPHTYRAVQLERAGSHIAGAGARTKILTRHAGPTLGALCRMPLRRHGELQAHMFVDPLNFLRLAGGLLHALDAIHGSHFVHCDLHSENIAIPVSDLHTGGLAGLVFEARLEQAILIDFGFSIDRLTVPYTTLPFARDGYRRRISAAFAQVLDAVEQEGLAQLRPGESWGEVALDPVFWRRLDHAPLALLCQITWREDFMQLGAMLADLRDGTGEFAFLGGPTVRRSSEPAVAALVESLPELLREWGEAPVAPDLARPHQALVARVDAAIAGRAVPAAQVALARADFAAAAPQRPPIVARVCPPRARPPEVKGSPAVHGLSGPFAGQRLALVGPLLFGREQGCDVLFPSGLDSIGRRHCTLRYDARRNCFYLRDLGSANGTYVNARKVQAQEDVALQPGDRFYLGKPDYSFEAQLHVPLSGPGR